MITTLILAGFALADDTATPEQSGRGDTGAEARTALGKAEWASAKTIALETRVAALEKTRRTVVKVGGDTSVIDAAIVQAKDELKASVKEDADRAEVAATRAETAATKAEDAATRAEAAAEKLEEFEMPLPAPATNSLDTVDRDDPGLVFYGAAGVGNAWLGRQETYVSRYVGSGNTVEVLEVDELLSNMIGLQLEGGAAGLGDKGRLSVGFRLEGEYNFGGGFAAIAEGVVGGFVEQTHVLRAEWTLGVAWETMPNGRDDEMYEEFRYSTGVGVELVPTEHFGILFTGRLLLDNKLDFNGNNGGMAGITLRFKGSSKSSP